MDVAKTSRTKFSGKEMLVRIFVVSVFCALSLWFTQNTRELLIFTIGGIALMLITTGLEAMYGKTAQIKKHNREKFSEMIWLYLFFGVMYGIGWLSNFLSASN